MAKIDTSRKLPAKYRTLLVVAASLVVSFLVVYLFSFSGRGAQRTDDYVISLFSSDLFPQEYPSLFIAKPMGLLLNKLSEWAPFINWFYLLERIVSWLSVAYVLAIGLLRIRPKSLMVALISAISIFLLLGSLQNSNFTYVATLSSVAGCVGLLICTDDRLSNRKVSVIVLSFGLLFFCVGMYIRFESWLLVVPFYLFTLCVLLFSHREKKNAYRCLIKKSVYIWLSFILCGVFFAADEICYEDEGYAYWEDYSYYRSKICDYPHPSYSSMQEQMRSIGISENDYQMAVSSSLVDQSYFSIEKLKQITDVLDANPISIENAAAKALTGERGRNVSVEISAITLAMLLLFIASIVDKRTVRIVIIMLLFAICLALYFISTGRFPQRVEYSIWACAFVFGLISIWFNSERLKRLSRVRRYSAITTSLVLLAVSAFLFIPGMLSYSPVYANAALSNEPRAEEGTVFDAVNTEDDVIYLVSPNAMALEKALYSYRFIPTSNFMSKNLYSSSWTMGSPQWRSVRLENGISEGIDWLIDSDKAYYLDTGGSEQYQGLITFIREHYFPEAVAEVSSSWADERGRQLVAYRIKSAG